MSLVMTVIPNHSRIGSEMLYMKHVVTEEMSGWVCYCFYLLDLQLMCLKPNHPGKMVQIGMNMGPRHAHILGWAVSFTRKLSDKEKTRQDANLLGGMSLLWALAKSYLPLDLTDPMQKLLDESYPTMATPRIPVGKYAHVLSIQLLYMC